MCLGEHTMQPYRRDDARRSPNWLPEFPQFIQWMVCNACGHIQTPGKFSKEAEALIYASRDLHQQPGMFVEDARVLFAPTVDRACQHLGISKPLLTPAAIQPLWIDVGFGSGALLFTAKEFGFRPYGFERDSRNVDQMSKFMVEGSAHPFEQAFMPGHADVISMMDVLEHVPSPLAYLAAAAQALRVGGVLVISTPAFDIPTWWTVPEPNPYYIELQHYHIFRPRILMAALGKFGLQPVDYQVSNRYRMGMEIYAKRVAE